jgi:hypothetical protein
MATETHTGLLIFSEGQVAVDDGTLLAIQGPNPCATAAAQLARWGQTQPVTVTGNTGLVNNTPVLFVTDVQWATQPVASISRDISPISTDTALTNPIPPPAAPPVATPPPKKKMAAKKPGNSSAKSKSKRSRS